MVGPDESLRITLQIGSQADMTSCRKGDSISAVDSTFYKVCYRDDSLHTQSLYTARKVPVGK